MTSNGLVPLIRYRDVAAAVDWLSTAFGFEKRNIVTDPDGTIAYAELSYGRGIVMLGPVGQSNLDRLLKQPDEVGGAGTQSVYVAVDDVESHFKHARGAGADIVLEFGSEEAGDRAYAARDPEGHVWNFGAYSPWPAVAVPQLAAAAEPAFAGRPSRAQSILGAAVAVLAVASVAGLATLDAQKPVPRFIAAPAAPATTGNDAETIALKETLAREAHARQEAARTAAAIREELAREREQRLAAETARNTLQNQLAQKKPAGPEAATEPRDSCRHSASSSALAHGDRSSRGDSGCSDCDAAGHDGIARRAAQRCRIGPHRRGASATGDGRPRDSGPIPYSRQNRTGEAKARQALSGAEEESSAQEDRRQRPALHVRLKLTAGH